GLERQLRAREVQGQCSRARDGDDSAQGGRSGHHGRRVARRRRQDHRPHGSAEGEPRAHDDPSRERPQSVMKLLAGTSGYAFKEWKGQFYPGDLADDGMLGFYAGRFATVEINNTFYRLPKENVLLEWAAQVPEQFTFALKASQ